MHNSGKQCHLQTQIKNNRRSMDTLWVWGFYSFVSPHSYRSLFYRTPASLAKKGCVPHWNSSAETGRALHLQTSVTPPLNTLSYALKHCHQCPWLPECCHLNYLIWQRKECIHTHIKTRTHSQGNERVSHKELRARVTRTGTLEWGDSHTQVMSDKTGLSIRANF